MGYLALVLLIFEAEFQLKGKVEERFEIGVDYPRAAGKVILTRYHNYGAFLNLGEKNATMVRIVSGLLCVVLLGYFIITLGQKGRHGLKIAMALLLGGGFSNVYDRTKRGFVVDYVSFQTPFTWLNRMVFNVSDFCIMIGSVLLTFCKK